jgi:hypothetical protein
MNIDSSLLENENLNEASDPEDRTDSDSDIVASHASSLIIRMLNLLFNGFFITPLVIIFW